MGQITEFPVETVDSSLTGADVEASLGFANELRGNKTASEIVYAIDEINPIKSYGAEVDGVKNDLDAFISASDNLGSGGVVQFASGVMFFDGVRPRLQDYPVVIDAIEGAELKCNLNPAVKELKLLSPLSTSSPTLSRDHVFHKNYKRDWINAIVGGSVKSKSPEQYTYKSGDFTTWNNHTVTINQNLNPGTATVAPDSVSWGSAFPSSQEGVFKSPLLFSTYECTFVRDDSAVGSPASSYIGATILFGSDRLIVAFREEDTGAKIFHVSSTGTLTTVENIELHSQAYTINQSGSLTIGIRLVSEKEFEVYSNDILIYSGNVSDFTTDLISLVGFTVTPEISPKISIRNLYQLTGRTPVSKRNSQIGIIGDSISYGAWASIDYATHLKQMLEATSFGTVTMRNAAVSGSSARTWVTGGVYGADGGSTPYSIATQDFSGDHYTIVALGTNDAIQGWDLSQYESDLTDIGNAIEEDGSIPIFCSFPTTKAAQSGYDRMPVYISSAKKVALANGWEFAQNREAFGTKDNLYFDNLHPHEVGQVHLATSIHEAIVTSNKRKVYGNPKEIREVTLNIDTFANSWVPAYGSTDRVPRIHVKDGKVSLSGLITGGAEGVAAFSIPYELFNRERDIFQTVTNRSGTDYLDATIYISNGGIVQVLGGTLSGSPWWVSLDGVSWDI